MSETPRLRPMSVGDMLDAAIRLYRKNFLTFVGIVALLQVPMMILQFITQFWLGANFMRDIMGFSEGFARTSPGANPFADFPLTSFIAFYGLLLALSIIQYLIVQNLITGALANAISRSYLDQPTSIMEAYAFGARRFFSLLAASLVPFSMSLVFGGVIVGCAVGVLSTLGVRPGEEANPGLIIASVLGLIGAVLVLIVLGLWITTRLVVTTQAIVLEGCGAIAGLRRSWQLVSGSFWRTLGIVTLMPLLIYFVSSIPSMIISSALNMSSGGALDATMRNQAIASLVGYIGIILALPLQLSIYTLLYYDLRVRKEGYDMELMLNQAAPA